jgi:general secretion pathway protein E
MMRAALVSDGILDFLVARGMLPAAQRERVRALRAERGESDAVILTRLGLVPERDMAKSLAAFHDLPLASPGDYPPVPLLSGRVKPDFLKRSRVLPLQETGDVLTLAMADPADTYAIEAMRLASGRRVLPWVAVPSELEAALHRLYGGDEAPAEAGTVGAADPEDVRRLSELARNEPVIRWVNALVARAVASRASDIHLEEREGELAVRLRVDGVLRESEAPPQRLRANIVSRVKVMAQLNIAERRLPQDGRFRAVVEGREVDVRVSIVPTLHGESAVLRLLDRDRAPLELPALGFSPAIETRLRELLAEPNGILLVTGPTGSGKTSTLYAALQLLNSRERKIVTVEDPVEYEIRGINQVQVRPSIGLEFATILRSLLRQDPDVLLVGEIRDVETARVAVQASLTGHLVLSTVHTNDAPSTTTRLVDMGLEEYLLASVLRGVLAQRLVRKLCPSCREPYEPWPELIQRGGLGETARLFRSRGCEHCGGTGYHGRTVIAELMPVDERLARLILSRADAKTVRAAAVEAGMTEMRSDALAKAREGVTSLDEVMRVAGGG